MVKYVCYYIIKMLIKRRLLLNFMRWERYLLALVLVLLLIPIALAQDTTHVKLLAVSVDENGTMAGNTADLYLELNNNGKGRVFIETFPVTKFDTQISTRFAKEIACDITDIDCSSKDFIYTIKANSPLIGGPSAGAATTIATLAALYDMDLNESIAMTGTINSGGQIGVVGGVKEKVEAAAKSGIKKVLIPKGTEKQKEDNLINITLSCSKDNSSITCKENSSADVKEIDMVAYGKNLSIEVIPVSDINEAFYQFTGKYIKNNTDEILVDQNYSEIMKEVSIILCNRTTSLQHSLIRSDIFDAKNFTNDFNSTLDLAANLSALSKEAFDSKMYYASASYCFGANAKYGEMLIKSLNASDEDILADADNLTSSIKAFEKEIDNKEKKTISDLQVYMVVKERLVEAKDLADEVEKDIVEEKDPSSDLAFAKERFFSALAWSQFFGMGGKEFTIDKEELRKSCDQKISEAEERIQYVSFYFPDVKASAKGLQKAYDYRKNEEYELCLSVASQSKAEADIILNVIGIDEKDVDNLIDDKLLIVKRELARETSKDIFPILGYSYYEYANSLKASDKYSALLYSEYALELSNLNIYFKEKNQNLIPENPYNLGDLKILYLVVACFLIGLIIGYLLFRNRNDEMIIKIN